MTLLLTPTEARVMGSLVEKSLTTPQYYPMTLNAVMLAANQKTVRYPLMALTEGEVGAALNRLEELRLASRDEHSGRALKWRHHVQHELLLKADGLGLLTTLILRGPQTAAELRANAVPVGGPAEAERVVNVLEDLADRAQPLVRLLPRQPGQSAARYVHLLCGEPEPGEWASAPIAASPRGADALEALVARIEALEQRVTELEQRR